MRALREMSIEMSSGCRDVEPEGLMSSAVQWSEEPPGIPNINGDQFSERRFPVNQDHRTLLLFARGKKDKKAYADPRYCNFGGI